MLHGGVSHAMMLRDPSCEVFSVHYAIFLFRLEED